MCRVATTSSTPLGPIAASIFRFSSLFSIIMLIDSYALACSKVLCYNTYFIEGAVPHGAGLTVALFLGLSLYVTICLLQAFATFVLNTVLFYTRF